MRRKNMSHMLFMLTNIPDILDDGCGRISDMLPLGTCENNPFPVNTLSHDLLFTVSIF